MLTKVKNSLQSYPIDFYMVFLAMIFLTIFIISAYSRPTQNHFEYVMNDVYEMARDISRSYRGGTWGENDIDNFLINYNNISIAVLDTKNQKLYSIDNTKTGAFYTLDPENISIREMVGYFRGTANNHNFIYGFAEISESVVLIKAYTIDQLSSVSRNIIIIMCISSLFCLWLTQKNNKTKLAPFEYLSNWIVKDYVHQLPKYELNSIRVAHIIHISLILTTSFYAVFALNSDADWTVFTIHLLIIFVACLSLFSYRSKNRSDIWSYLFSTVLFFGPIIMHVSNGVFMNHMFGITLLWTMSGVLLMFFLISSIKSKKIFRTYVYFLFGNTVAVLIFFEQFSHEVILSFVAALFFLGFSLYTTIDIYITNSQKDYIQINDLLKQLQENRDVDIQKEKMATLGQLVASIAHEINTPIGAIKASGDQIDYCLSSNFENIIKATNEFDEDQFVALNTLIQKTRESLAEMKSTSEVRKAKKEMLNFFEERAIADSRKIVNRLTALEICDMDFVKENLDLFHDPRIDELLGVLVNLSPIITGSQTITHASHKVSKIIFALKSYTYVTNYSDYIIFDINHTIDNMLLLYRNQMHNIELIQNIPDDLPKVLGNPYEISQVWNNIIHNALYAMSTDLGILTIQVDSFDDHIQVSIRDNGEGIDEDSLAKVFDPFFSTKPSGEGSGLGLDVCKRILAAHKGEIWAESEVGTGTCFYVKLPIIK